MKYSIVALAMFLGALVQVYAQDASEILKKYTEVTGGQDQWKKVTSFQVKGTAKLISQAMELPFVRTMEKDGKQKTSLTVNGMEYVASAYDGTVVWGTNQNMEPEEKGSDEAENIKRNIHDFPFPGFEWDKRGYQASFEGEELVNEVKTYKVKMTKIPQMVEGEEVANVEFLYFDQASYLPILRESEVVSGMNKGQLMRTFLEDYKRIDGLMYPTKVTMKYDDQTFQILESHEVVWNIAIDPSLYKMPGP